MTLPEGLRYYILRDDVVVPLVPVDQLPFQLQDLPRQLTSRQMGEAGWKFVGETQERPLMLAIQAPAALSSQPVLPMKTTHLAPDHDVRKSPLFSEQALQPLREVLPASAIHQEQTSLRPTNLSLLARPAFVTDTTGSNYPREIQRPDHRTLTPPRTQPAPRQKEYCDFWMRTGECNYADFTKSREGKGCIYKHEMPSDRNKLRELGFPHGVPRWYKEKTAIAAAGGLDWLQRGIAQGSYDRKLSDEPQASLAFNPSKFTNTRNECRSEEISKPTLVEPKQAPFEVGDLISFDDSPVTTPEASPRASDSSCSSVASCETDVLIFPPSKLLLQTMASTLRGEARQITDKASEDNSEAQPIDSSSVASDNERHTKLSTPRSKRRSRQRKPVERPADPGTQNGLARSKHATGGNSKKANNPSKGGKRHGNGMERQSEITQCQRASHEKNRLEGHSASSSIQRNISVEAALA